MKFQSSVGGYPFVHGYFFDETGPYFRGEGLIHLSDNFFCRADALAFIREALGTGRITQEEAHALLEDKELLKLPDHVPSSLEKYRLYRLRRGKEKVEKSLEEWKRYYGLSFYVQEFWYRLKLFIKR